MDSPDQNSWKSLSFINSYALTHQKPISKQLYSSDNIMVQVWTTLYHLLLEDLALNQK